MLTRYPSANRPGRTCTELPVDSVVLSGPVPQAPDSVLQSVCDQARTVGVINPPVFHRGVAESDVVLTSESTPTLLPVVRDRGARSRWFWLSFARV